MKTISELREATDRLWRRVRGVVRRVTVTAHAAGGTPWQAAGYRDEVFQDVEVFGVVGVTARPPAGSRSAEAVVVNVGAEAGHPIIVATRDAGALPTAAKDLAADEVMLHTSQAWMKVTKDGDVIVRAKAGRAVLVADNDTGAGAVALATKADLDALKSAINTATVTPGDGGAQFKATLMTALAAWPVGTTVLKGK